MTIEDYRYLIAEYATENGLAYTDDAKTASFVIFQDRIAIHSNFLSQRVFEIFEDEGELSISTTKVNATGDAMISAEMEDEDWDVVYLHWEKLLHDLKYVKQLEKLDIPAAVTALLAEIPGETANNIPAKIEANPVEIWEVISKELTKRRLLTSFYWEDWATKGIPALNQLSAVIGKKIVIKAPTAAEEEEIGTTLYYTTAILNFFNKQLEQHDLTIVALGAQFEELQTFACIEGNTEQLEGIIDKLEQLCLKFEY